MTFHPCVSTLNKQINALVANDLIFKHHTTGSIPLKVC